MPATSSAASGAAYSALQSHLASEAAAAAPSEASEVEATRLSLVQLGVGVSVTVLGVACALGVYNRIKRL